MGLCLSLFVIGCVTRVAPVGRVIIVTVTVLLTLLLAGYQIGLFNEIVANVVAHDNYFAQKTDSTGGKLGLTPPYKTCSAVQQLTSGVLPDDHDDKDRTAASTGMESLKRFCNAVTAVFSKDTLPRQLNVADIDRLLDEGNVAGFPGSIGSLDCKHWEWKNRPSAWKEIFRGKAGVPTVTLEAIADSRMRFWHFNFGSPGTLNDLNICEISPLFENAV